MMSVLRFLCVLMSSILAWFVTLQFNDVDASIWIAAYGAASVLTAGCLWPRLRKVLPTAARIASVVYGAWGLWLFGQTSGQWWDGEIEREVGGLWITTLWMLCLSFISKRMSRFE